LNKGEGKHFLIGFGEHLRNLLVCKDAATAGLLETAPSIRSHYVEQSGRCPIGVLLKLLDINNRCDLNYKTSNNKRLHLELSLMQMCAPMMRQEALPPVASPAPPNPAMVAAPGASANSDSGIQQATGVLPVPASGTRTPADGTKHAGSPEIPHDAAPRKAVETVKMRDIKNDFTSTTSIRKPLPKTENDGLPSDEELARNEIATPFTQAELVLYWDEYAEKLKNDYPHLYSTLKSSRPVLQDNWMIGFTLDNKVLDDELTLRKTDMMEFLRIHLNNYKIQLQTTIAETQKNLKPYTDKEKYELMAGKNPALRTLREELDLEIEY
jgi:DNA polymerase-3 subunit gamma/tau